MPEAIKPQWFHILLALSDRDLHGYGIQRAVKELSDGTMMLWPAMLYRSLDGLRKRGWIEEAPEPEGVTDERCQFYRLTPAGRIRLKAETERMAQLVALARSRVQG